MMTLLGQIGIGVLSIGIIVTANYLGKLHAAAYGKELAAKHAAEMRELEMERKKRKRAEEREQQRTEAKHDKHERRDRRPFSQWV